MRADVLPINRESLGLLRLESQQTQTKHARAKLRLKDSVRGLSLPFCKILLGFYSTTRQMLQVMAGENVIDGKYAILSHMPSYCCSGEESAKISYLQPYRFPYLLLLAFSCHSLWKTQAARQTGKLAHNPERSTIFFRAFPVNRPVKPCFWLVLI